MKCKYCDNDAAPAYLICKECLQNPKRLEGRKKFLSRWGDSPKQAGWIYLVKDPLHKLYKIGYSYTHDESRLDDVRAFLPLDPVLIHEVRVYDCRKAESVLHRYFRRFHYNREWFKFPFWYSEKSIIQKFEIGLNEFKLKRGK